MSSARHTDRVILFIWLALLVLAAPARGDVHVGWTLETGAEYDSNATRIPDGQPLVQAADLRLTTAIGLTARAGGRNTFVLSQAMGGKLFLNSDANGENVFVDDTHLGWTVSLSPAWLSGVDVDYYDAFQAGADNDPRRDFRLGSASPRLVYAPSGERAVGLFAGYRAFQYKPDATQDYWGPLFGVIAHQQWVTGNAEDEREWQLDASYQLNLRTFNGPNYNSPETTVAGTTRADRFHFGELRGTYVGSVLMGLGYGLQWNDSSSYGFGHVRHIVTLRLALRLPGHIALATRATLQLLKLEDPTPIDPRLYGSDSFDNENRSSVELSFERPLAETVRAVLRYSFYVSSLGTPATSSAPGAFYRHLVFAGLSFQIVP
jgi:hypothetical protein